MTPATEATERLERTVAYLQENLGRVVDRVQAVFVRNSGARGACVLDDATVAEHRALNGLLGRPHRGKGPLRVNLARLEQDLQEQGLAPSLESLLAAYYNAPVVTRQAQQAAERTARDEATAQCSAKLEAVAAALPMDSRARRWLETGPHGNPWLIVQWRRRSAEALDATVSLLRSVVTAVNHLPRDPPERLAPFANRVLDSPHALDVEREGGRLFLRALLDCFADAADLAVEDDPAALGPEERRRLYAAVGLTTDTVSSTVTVYNLGIATDREGRVDPLTTSAGARVLVVPLCQLLEWAQVETSRSVVYLVENPAVFEDLVLSLTAQGSRAPTVLCSAGWPSLAVHRLLTLLMAADPRLRYYYSGDFDVAGLHIARLMLSRYPAMVPWRLTAADYRQALQAQNPRIHQRDLAALERLRETFPDLVDALRSEGRWAYQEGISALLQTDLVGHGNPANGTTYSTWADA